MDNIKAAAKESYIRKGVIDQIETRVVERPRHTFLGSTDRKAYTIEINCQWMDEHSSLFVEITPWGKDQKEIVEELTEKAKHDFASEIIKQGKI